jgi:hypothetical protein
MKVFMTSPNKKAVTSYFTSPREPHASLFVLRLSRPSLPLTLERAFD